MRQCMKSQVKFLPPNSTSILQPADAGIIRSFKAQYRKLFVQHQLQLFDDIMESNSRNEIGKYNIKHAIYNVSNAWNNVTMETIQNCSASFLHRLPNVFLTLFALTMTIHKYMMHKHLSMR